MVLLTGIIRMFLRVDRYKVQNSLIIDFGAIAIDRIGADLTGRI